MAMSILALMGALLGSFVLFASLLLVLQPETKIRFKAIRSLFTNRTFYVATASHPGERPSIFAYFTTRQEERLAESIQHNIEADYRVEQVKSYLTELNGQYGEELF